MKRRVFCFALAGSDDLMLLPPLPLSVATCTFPNRRVLTRHDISNNTALVVADSVWPCATQRS